MNKLMLFTFSAFILPTLACAYSQYDETKTIASPLPQHTIMREHSSLKDAPEQMLQAKRPTDYPTHIVRMTAVLSHSTLSCEEVFNTIDTFFDNHISPDKFFYNTINYCSYDPATSYATQFTINSYFDPLNDEAIAFLEKYVEEHNGHDLLGTPFYVEKASGLVVSLTMDSGMENEANPYELLRIRTENHSHYFASNYAMRLELTRDIRQRFFSNNPKFILPFIDKWFFTATGYYMTVLRNSNYVELRPELVFMMDQNPKIFTPMLKLYYGHHCSKYENQRCMM